MTDVHALSGAYAIDALDDLERAQFERHLADCADCRAEVASLQEASALVGETSAMTPPPQLRERVLASIGTVRPLPPVVTEISRDQRDGHRRRRFQGLVAAAAAVTVLGAGAAVWQPWADDETSQHRRRRELIGEGQHRADRPVGVVELEVGTEVVAVGDEVHRAGLGQAVAGHQQLGGEHRTAVDRPPDAAVRRAQRELAAVDGAATTVSSSVQ